MKMYVKLNIDRHFKFLMTRFRLGISDIAVLYYQYKRHAYNDLICPLCGEAHKHTHTHTELHFVLFCHMLIDLREVFIPAKFHKFPSLLRLSLHFKSNNEDIVWNLSVFCTKPFSYVAL